MKPRLSVAARPCKQKGHCVARQVQLRTHAVEPKLATEGEAISIVWTRPTGPAAWVGRTA
jgi:uncharacterized protein (DUF1499 family)